MHTDTATPSRMERAYAVAVAVSTVVFFIAILFAGSVTNGFVDLGALKSQIKNLLAFIGVISLALWVGTCLPHSLAPTKNSFILAFLRFGVPLFALSTIYFWLFPTSISFAEHVGSNFFYAILVAFAARKPN